MTDIPTIRRRRDGSIDTDYYIENGRCRRSFAAHELASSTARKTRRALVALKGFVASAPTRGGQCRRSTADDAGI